jgi:hypothetical protein
MRRFVTLVVLLLFSIPFGVSISGCSHNAAPTFCNGGDTGITTGQVTTITLSPIVYGISLNYAEIGQLQVPSSTDCKGQNAAVGAYTYATTDMTIADVQPSTGRLCGGTWNRNTGGGIPDYTVCNPTSKSGTAYVTASADGVTSNPLPVFVHPVVTSIVLGAPSSISSAAITAWSISANTPTFTAVNTFTAGQVVSLYNFPTSTFFNGVTTAVVQAAGLSGTQFTVTIPGFTHANGSATESGQAYVPNCTTDPTTACCPLSTSTAPPAPPYLGTSCLSQGSTAQLAARVFAGSGANQTNISCLAGHLQFSAQSLGTTSISPVVSVDQNGVATANQPGSVLITADVADASSSAGFFSTCPPVSITLTAPGTTGNPVAVNENNTQPLQATAVDANGVTLTGLSLEYVSTSPTTIPAGSGSVTPSLAGAAAITAICQPPSCNSSSNNQIGLFGNGKPVASNSVNISAPGTNGTVLYMASTQSQYIVSRDFTQPSQGQPLFLPYLPNSMVLSNDGSTLYLGSTTALMVVNAVNQLSISRADIGSPGSVLAISPDGGTIVLSDPLKQITTLESSSGSVITTFGGVGTHAEFAPDSQTVYITAGNQLLVYSNFTGWTSIATSGAPVNDVAITVPSVGAYFAGPTTTARGYCPSTTQTGLSTANVFYPQAFPSIISPSTVATDRIAATNDGLHILGATVTTSPTIDDFHVTIPVGACPASGGLTFATSISPFTLSLIAPTQITGILPTSDSSLAFITYTGTGGVLPAYAPAASGPGTVTYIKLSGTAVAPVAGVVSADNSTVYAGTTGDNLVHLITRSTLTDSSTLSPNLTSPSGGVVPVNLLAQKPRRTT